MTGIGMVDAVVGAAVLLAAAVALLTRDRLTSVVTFILLGGLLAVLWTAVRAPDVALAEAAIGTGVTGALLVDAVADRRETRAARGRGRGRIVAWAAAAAGGVGLIVALVAGVLGANASSGDAPLTGAVDQAMDSAAVQYEITAVLLDFRAYDTLLEVAVILAAVVGAYALAAAVPAPRDAAVSRAETDPHALPDPRSEPAPGALPGRTPAPTLVDFLRVASPVLLLLAAWLLFAGAYQPGGAFQGGAMLAGTAILAAGAGAAPTLLEGLPGRVIVTLGPLAFLAAGGAGALFAGHWLHMPPGLEAPATVLVETALAVTIGAGLATIFLTVRRRPRRILAGDRT